MEGYRLDCSVCTRALDHHGSFALHMQDLSTCLLHMMH